MAKKEKKEEQVLEEPQKAEEPKSEAVWTPEGSLEEQIEKQRLINEGKLKRA